MKNKLIIEFNELAQGFFSEVYDSNKLLQEYSDSQMTDFIYQIVWNMGIGKGGVTYFWVEEEEDRALKDWVIILRKYTGRQLYKTLYLIRTGKELTPRDAMGFQNILLNGDHHRLVPSVEETLSQPGIGYLRLGDFSAPPLNDLQKGEQYLHEMREQIKPILKKGWPKKPKKTVLFPKKDILTPDWEELGRVAKRVYDLVGHP